MTQINFKSHQNKSLHLYVGEIQTKVNPFSGRLNNNSYFLYLLNRKQI